MAVESKQRDTWQYGDFQTPPALASDVCALLARRGIDAAAILEPTCGRGAFVKAAAHSFPYIRTLLGVEINADYVAAAREAVGTIALATGTVAIEAADFFATDWDMVLARDTGPWLILGNPPWVTNADLGLLKSSNLPIKSNFQGHKGLDAITGKANFDISEWMLLEQIAWLRQRSGWIAMLVKTSVARKVLRQAWKRADPVGRAAIFKFDAMRHFGAAVDACLFILPVNMGARSLDCDVYDALDETALFETIGLHDATLVSNVPAYLKYRHLVGPNKAYVWRSGVKHDCSKVMELSMQAAGQVLNGYGEEVRIERTYLFPMLKSSDVAKGLVRTNRLMIVTQRVVGGNTSEIEVLAPATWNYLIEHAGALDARASVIYRKKPRFSMFGVGNYTFAPWKVAVSGFYKDVRFVKVGPVNGHPIVFDDTIYFLPCWSEDEASFILSLLDSDPCRGLLAAMIFSDEKRPVTADLLKRISLEYVANELGLAEDYRRFTRRQDVTQPEFALAG